jgi:hypothetical protein
MEAVKEVGRRVDRRHEAFIEEFGQFFQGIEKWFEHIVLGKFRLC